MSIIWQIITKNNKIKYCSRVLVPFGFEESVPQMSWQDKLFSLGWHPDFWRPLLPRHQETPAGVLHMWCVMNRMPDADMGCMCESRKQTFFLCLVPRYLLEDVGRGSVDPFLISDYTHGEIYPGNLSCFWLACELSPLSPAGGWYTGPTYRPQNVLFTNCVEMIEKILGMWCQENPG